MDAFAIRVEGLGKRFRLHHRENGSRYHTLREELISAPRALWARLRRRRAEQEEFWALKEVSFEVKQGEVLGIIGRNGAGKSTLLKILSRIMDPTCGEATVHGRIGSLLEVGTGFHPELTGRENIFLSGALLGMKRDEVRRRFDEIVAFAGVEKFLDTPCKHYSSGMYTRLGFAVAAHLDTEILLVDEVLAVGDAEFRERCRAKMANMVRTSGRVVILVSHESALVRSLCSRLILLSMGKIVMDGSVGTVLQAYHRKAVGMSSRIVDQVGLIQPGFVIERVRVGGSETLPITLPANAATLEVEISGHLDYEVRMTMEVRLLDCEGSVLAIFSPGHMTGHVHSFKAGPFTVAERIRLPRLLKGTYFLGISLTDPNKICWYDIRRTVRLDVEGATTQLGMLNAGSHCGVFLLEDDAHEITGS